MIAWPTLFAVLLGSARRQWRLSGRSGAADLRNTLALSLRRWGHGAVAMHAQLQSDNEEVLPCALAAAVPVGCPAAAAVGIALARLICALGLRAAAVHAALQGDAWQNRPVRAPGAAVTAGLCAPSCYGVVDGLRRSLSTGLLRSNTPAHIVQLKRRQYAVSCVALARLATRPLTCDYGSRRTAPVLALVTRLA